MVRVAFYCPKVRGTVNVRDCAYCRCFKEDPDQRDVNECRQENLVAVYECNSCGSFMPLGALLDPRGNLVCAHCVMNGTPARERVAVS
jgi:hypothetical protein